MRIIRCDRCNEEVSLVEARHVTVHKIDGQDEGWDFCEHCLTEILEFVTSHQANNPYADKR